MTYFRVATLLLTTALSAQPVLVPAQQPGSKFRPVLDPYKHRQAFVGNWLMSRRTPDGGEATWLIRREVGGTYKRTTRVAQPDGSIISSEDVGRWGVVNNSLFTMMRGRTLPKQSALNRADPSDPYSYDVYRVRRQSTQQLELQSMHTGELISERKVPDSFSLTPRQIAPVQLPDRN